MNWLNVVLLLMNTASFLLHLLLYYWCSTNVSTSVFYQKLPTLLLPLKTWVYESVENFYLNITGSVWTDSWLRTAVLDGVSRLLSTEILLQLNNKRTIHHELGYTLFW